MTDTFPLELAERLRRHDQQHLLRWWDELAAEKRRELIAQIEAVDFELIGRLFEEHRRSCGTGNQQSPAERADRATSPAKLVRLPKSCGDDAQWAEATRCGREALSAGKVGAVLVAGGQGTRLRGTGTRLRFEHPKGMYPIGPVSGCSLFQIFAEQIFARSREAGARIPYYVMTSDITHDETTAFFREHDYFGLNAEDVIFFRQGNMPAVDDQTGRVLLAEKGKLSTSPDGHGGLLAALTAAGLFDEMRERGIEQLYYHQVDNPMAKVCDPAFLGFHLLGKSELSTKVVAKRSAEEPMGVLVELDGQTQIVEYSDLPIPLACRTDDNGELLLWAGNTAIHIFDRAFLERLSGDEIGLPLHLAHKSVAYIDESGQSITPDVPNAFKFERFIFDALPLARRALVVEADRACEFNPVKNVQGDDSPETAKAAMSSLFADWLRAAGAEFDAGEPIEISPLFAVDAKQVRAQVSPGTKLTGPVHLK